MIYKTFTIALALLTLTACQKDTTVNQGANPPLDGLALTRLAYQHDADCRAELRNSDEPVLADGTPVAMTGVCKIARDKPLFAIEWPDSAADEFQGLVRQGRMYPASHYGHWYVAHLENNPHLEEMKQGQKYRVEGRITGGGVMCYGAYFIEVDRFTAID
jgi:hypothetical protein